MPKIGSQCILCDLPVRFDTYKGCSHGCRYCFAQRKNALTSIEPINEIERLRKFIAGNRTKDMSWIDWDIPIHIGGMSDPLQPCEKKYGITKASLELLAETQYPFIISTKGKLVADDEYLDLLSKCNCVVQISAVCSKYDQLEKGAPTFNERMEIIRKIAPRVKRVVVRVQPFMHEVFKDIYNNLETFKEVGAYGFIVEGIKLPNKTKGLVKVGTDYTYPYDIIKNDFWRLKGKAKEIGLKIYAGENRLRKLGDSMSCCGIDGLEGFKGNTYNLCHILNGDNPIPSEAQKKKNSGAIFAGMLQRKVASKRYEGLSFEEAMLRYYKEKKAHVDDVMGVNRF